MKKITHRVPQASVAERVLAPQDEASSPRLAEASTKVSDGRRGGLKSAINRPLPAEAAARRKAALHDLRLAFTSADAMRGEVSRASVSGTTEGAAERVIVRSAATNGD